MSDGEAEKWTYLRKALVEAGLLKRDEERHTPSVLSALFLAVDSAKREAHRTDADKAADAARVWLLDVMSGKVLAQKEQLESAALLLGARR